jgi:hypothetical protein
MIPLTFSRPGGFVSCDPATDRYFTATWFTSPGGLFLMSADTRADLCMTSDQLVIEAPWISEQTDGKDPNDIVKLRGAVERGAAEFEMHNRLPRKSSLLITPQQWKGNLPKIVVHWRIVTTILSPAERQSAGITDAVMDYLKKRRGIYTKTRKDYRAEISNTLDAIAIGLFACGRTDNKGMGPI